MFKTGWSIVPSRFLFDRIIFGKEGSKLDTIEAEKENQVLHHLVFRIGPVRNYRISFISKKDLILY